MRVSVRQTADLPVAAVPGVPTEPEPEARALPLPVNGLVRVESPMVGTFYRAPAPGAAPFVEEGDAVAAGETLCILEAMKLMNEVKAEIEAIVRSINVGNGDRERPKVKRVACCVKCDEATELQRASVSHNDRQCCSRITYHVSHSQSVIEPSGVLLHRADGRR